MRSLYCLLLVGFSFFLSACSVDFSAFVRNLSNETAMIDVFLLNKDEFMRLPNKVKVANQVVKFKSGVRDKFKTLENVKWIDTSHFKFAMAPQTSIDLTDMAGKFLNSHPTHDVRVIISTATKVDTILDGYRNYNSSKFEYTNFGLRNPALYYDIKP